MYRAGEVAAFQNIFSVRPTATPETLDLHYLSPTRALVVDGDQVRAWCSVDPQGRGINLPGLAMQAAGAMITPQAIMASGARHLYLEAGSA